MFFHQGKVSIWMGKAFVLVLAIASLATSSTARADTLASGYAVQSYDGVAPDGQFTAYDGQINYWTSAGGYQIYNTTSGATTTIGLPPNGTITNGGGDAFGVLDPGSNVFYAATIAPDYSSYVYAYNPTTLTWSNSTSAGVHLANAYGGQVYDGQLYVSGLPSTWSGGSGTTGILAFGPTAIASGTAPQTLIQAPGNSAYLAVAPDGDVYYATNSYGSSETDNLYHWTAQQIANVGSTPLSTIDAQLVCAVPGNGNGLAVDSAGNVFFAVNDSETGNSTLAMLDPNAANGYDTIYSGDGDYDYFNAISVDGNFLHGGTLYMSNFDAPTYHESVMAIQAVPEPGSFVLLASAMALLLVARRWRRS